MADYPPFMTATKLITKILNSIKNAQTPDKFTQDYLGTTLGYTGGSARSFIPLAKRIGFLSTDGTPSNIYNEFRNPSLSGIAIAKAIRIGYVDLFRRNESVHKLDRESLKGFVVQATGLNKDSPTLRAIIGTFEALKELADFENREAESEYSKAEELTTEIPTIDSSKPGVHKLGISYTINLVLPKTSDVAVFDAIFSSLREKLLK